MNCEEAIQLIHSGGSNQATPGLSRISNLLERLGNPQQNLKYVHVAGTNGKGSTCAMLHSVLRAAGYRVGLFTSPYIQDFRERIRIDGEPVGENALAEWTERILQITREMDEPFTEFELITAIGFAYFNSQNVDVVVLEVGLGGRFDPTNVINKPLLSIITGIDFDHTALLGNTIQSIAAEKAGIIKEDCPVLYGGEENAACRTIRSFADLRHAVFHTVDRSTFRQREATLDGTVFDFGEYEGLELSLLGTYQPYNATVVLTALEILKTEHGFVIPENAVREGLKSVTWQARFELLSKDPIIIYDGGHNPQGVNSAVKSIQAYFPEEQVNILSGVMIDKDFDAMIEALKPVANKIFTVTPQNPRALTAKEYAEHCQRHKLNAVAYESIEAAVSAAIEECKREHTPLICLGSLYLYKEVSTAIAEYIG
ncbi:MAG: bifunctional folylpolyglutamate synthase/dihydrofolate synthase [Clostridia bacterium]|nr:bifunctional folylpolyglutamate synthase/dihydrofolate synthase [Clostridia bacterium]